MAHSYSALGEFPARRGEVRPSRYAFLDLVAYNETPPSPQKRGRSMPPRKLGHMFGCNNLMGGVPPALETALATTDTVSRLVDARDGIASLDGSHLDRELVIAADGLLAWFHGDPADRLIVATARTHAMPLATRDRAIRRSRIAKLWSP